MKQIFQAVVAFVLVAGSIDFVVSKLLDDAGEQNTAGGNETGTDASWVHPFVSSQIEGQQGLLEEHRSALVDATLMALRKGCHAEDIREWGWTLSSDPSGAFTFCPAGGTPGPDNRFWAPLESGPSDTGGFESDWQRQTGLPPGQSGSS